MADAGAVGSGIEGLVGGFLMGSDFSRQRRFDRQDNEDRRRRQRLEDERLRMFREDRGRSQAIADLALRDQYGLAYGQPEPTPVEQLRTGTGKALMTFEDLQNPEARSDVLQARAMGRDTPEGFYRVAPDPLAAETERVRALREGVGQFLAAPEGQQRGMLSDPNVIGGLGEYDLLDDIMERYGATEDPRYSVSVGGITTKANTPEEAIAARDRFTIPEEEGAAGPDDDELFARLGALADDFHRDIVDYEFIGKALRQAESAGDNAVGDQTLIFALNNMLDPGVTVRQDDFVRYAESGDMVDRAERYWNMLGKDGRLPKDVLGQLKAEIQSTAAVNEQRFGAIADQYRQRAERFGVDPDLFMRDPFRSGSGTREARPGEVGQITGDMTGPEILEFLEAGPATTRGPGGR